MAKKRGKTFTMEDGTILNYNDVFDDPSGKERYAHIMNPAFVRKLKSKKRGN
ncbi:uncharacterized protein METZ01_LOCUS436416 [marine metagenome]|uniref:Uncharacterized protein n=1 Tax=marine metagenome TaxID=408172 RepID=A0A382YJU8_9ZZZZ